MPRGRPPKTTASPFIVINDQHITWSFIKKVYVMCGSSWDETIDAFYKARNATGNNAIYRYIMAGIRKKWIFLPSREREQGKMVDVYKWWSRFYTPKSGTSEPIHSEIKSMLDSLVAKMSL